MIIFAHRGASGYEPENTLRSFRKAIALGVKAVECDVWKCKSGELVVIHDEKVNRTTNGKGCVKQLTYHALRSLNAGRGEHIPLLTEVMDSLRGKVLLNVEIKDEMAVSSLAKILKKEFVSRRWKKKDIIISSFNDRVLCDFHRLCPGLMLGSIIKHPVKKEIVNGIKNGFFSLNIPLKETTKEFIKQAHSYGLKVFVWMVDKKPDIQKMKLAGADGIFTNYPDRALK